MMNKRLIQQAQQMQSRLAKAQQEIEAMMVEGTAGGGAVHVVMTGQQRLQKVQIAPEAVEDVEMLQDLVLAAVNDAQEKVQKAVTEKMSAVTGGMKIPGLF
jgi:DNA-binding YbaB/EbfC family protein